MNKELNLFLISKLKCTLFIQNLNTTRNQVLEDRGIIQFIQNNSNNNINTVPGTTILTNGLDLYQWGGRFHLLPEDFEFQHKKFKISQSFLCFLLDISIG